MRMLVAGLVAAGLLAGCAAPPAPPASRAEVCEDLLGDYERALRFTNPYTRGSGDRAGPLRSEIARPAGRIIRGDCLTFFHDLPDLVGLRMALGPAGPAPQGGLPPTAVFAGVVAGLGEEIAVLQFFRGRGWGARGIDAPGLGRRIYVGPFTSEAAVAEAIATARRAGFVAPQPSEGFRFGVIPSLL